MIGQYYTYREGEARNAAISVPTINRARDLMASVIGSMNLRSYNEFWNGEEMEKIYIAPRSWLRRPDPRFAYIAPTYGQAKRVAWDYLVNFTRPLDAAHNISELKVDFYGRRIQLYGSDNPDSLRGQYFDGVILDEIGDQNPKI